MSKKESAASIAKVTLLQVLPPSLVSTVRTSDFPLECFGKGLHLASPMPVFELDSSKGWYSGIPISVIAVVTNKRFQVLKNVQINVQVRVGRYDLFKTEHKFEGEIRAQKWTMFPFQATCPIAGDLEITASLRFSFEDLPQVLRVSEVVKIKQSLVIKYSMRKKPSEIIQFSVQNATPFRFLNLRASTMNGLNFPVVEGLDADEGVSAYFRPKGATTRLQLSWDLPHAKNCSQVIGLKEKDEEPAGPITVEVSDLPEFCCCLKPFNVHVKIRNSANTPMTGYLAFNQSEQLIRLVGKSALDFENVVEKEFDLTLVSLWQGALQLPPFVVHLNDGSKSVVDVNQGIMVVGYAEE